MENTYPEQLQEEVSKNLAYQSRLSLLPVMGEEDHVNQLLDRLLIAEGRSSRLHLGSHLNILLFIMRSLIRSQGVHLGRGARMPWLHCKDGSKAGAEGVGDRVSAGIVRGDGDETKVTSSSIVGDSLGWGARASLGRGVGARAKADGPPKDGPVIGFFAITFFNFCEPP